MNEAQNLSLSLLSQEEIDTLVSFLLEKKNSVDSSVLNQVSIDKLIELIHYDNMRRKQEVFTTYTELEGDLRDVVTVRGQKGDVCRMSCEKAADTGYITIQVINDTSGESMVLTPSSINEGDGEEWGKCIVPALFCKLAVALDVKYTVDTYESICQSFAEEFFGDGEHKIPFFYLPGNELMLKNLL